MNYTETLTRTLLLTDFQEIRPEDIPLLSDYFRRYGSRSCDYTIGGTLMWADYFRYRYAIVENTLFMAGESHDGNTIYFYCLSDQLPSKAAQRMLHTCARTSGKECYLVISEESRPEEEIASSLEFPLVEEWKEYLYDARKFITFAGRRMEKKRNHLNFFRRNYPAHTIERISGSNIEELYAFTRRQAEKHDNPLFLYENAATLRVLSGYDLYPFEGIAIRVDEQIAGYTFGEQTGDTLHVHVEKGDISFRGIYQALASALCSRMLDKYPGIVYVNREEDMGNADLRRSKESYHPDLYVNKRLLRLS